MLQITRKIAIPEDELEFKTSRSGGPGGQSVNKNNTRVTLLFDIDATSSLTDRQKRRLRGKLSSRINKSGILRVVAQEHRSQSANRKAAVSRFAELVKRGLERPKRRIKTRRPRRANQRRLDNKKHRGRIKKNRSWRPGPED